MTDLHFRLRALGLSDVEAEAKGRLFTLCEGALESLGGAIAERDVLRFFVPGRIEVLGKHTDYAGGRSLLCAMERGFAVLAAPRDDNQIRVVESISGDRRDLVIDAGQQSVTGDWSSYVAAVARGLARNFPNATRGVDLAFASDLPAASGMSSSSALVIAVFLALEVINDLASDITYRRVITSNETLGGYLGAVENGRSYGPFAGDLGVGTLGGSQDQTAILCSQAGALSQYSFCPVRGEGSAPFPDDKIFAVAYSGVAAAKTANALQQYNEASLAVSAIVDEWNRATGRSDECLAHAAVSSPDAPDRIRSLLRAVVSRDFTAVRLVNRFEQYWTEAEDIIPLATAAFAADDMDALSGLVDRSQRGAEGLLGNQVPETIELVRLAREYGAFAASAFGAGFGGSVWALVLREGAERFLEEWRLAYGDAFSDAASRAEFFLTMPGPPATRL